MKYKVLAYYYIGQIDCPQEEIQKHKKFFEGRDFRGRIYISEQGINGQASGSAEDADAYIAWMKEDARFEKIPFKIHASSTHEFPKMTVKYRKQLVAIDCEVDFSMRGESLSPSAWRAMLEKKTEETLLIDVRNDYEWKVGHFEGAELLPLETFRQFPLYAKSLKEKCDPKSTPVMMYCTGGIRCEFFSALLKKEGFDQVYQLDGGVIEYGLEEGDRHWEGKLFVFDDRLVVPINGEEKPPISHCTHCNALSDTYYNCANMDCNRLFLSCKECIPEHKGCCSHECLDEKRIRPYQLSSKPFRKWDHQEKAAWKNQQESDAASVPSSV